MGRRAGELEDGGEGASTARANGRRFAPLTDAGEAELMQALETASDGVVLIEANGTHIFVGAALLVLDLRGLLELLLQGLYLGLHVKCCLAEMLKLLHQLPALISHLVCFRLFVLP